MSLYRLVWRRGSGCLLGALLLLCGVLGLPRAMATTLIMEGTEFSDDPLNPSIITPALQIGTNLIQGSVDGHPWGTDHDYFRVTLPPDGRVAGLSLTVTNFSTSMDSMGSFEVLPSEQGNVGGVDVAADGTQTVPFAIATRTNIILGAIAPFALEFGSTTFFRYEVELVVAPVDVVAGTAIHTAVEITFPSEAGESYQLQCTSDVASGQWSNLGGIIEGVGGTMSAFDSTRHSGQRFYRVLTQ